MVVAVSHAGDGAGDAGPAGRVRSRDPRGAGGLPREGLAALREAAALVEETGERYVEAEIHRLERLEGNLLLAENGSAEPEACYLRALAVARAQEARSLELRAARDLARLWAEQGWRSEARDLVAPVYGWFTEGFDTADLKEAKALLDKLTEPAIAAEG
jgi:predicted ATPase